MSTNRTGTGTDMVYTLFKMFADFIEKEKPLVNIDWKSNNTSIDNAVEIRDLYRWWKVDRQREVDRCDALLHEWAKEVGDVHFEKCSDTVGFSKMVYNKPESAKARMLFDKIQEEEARAFDKETKQLIRLINLRSCLWA